MTQGFIGYKFSAAGFAKVLIRAIFGAILLAMFSTTANAACPGSLPKTLTNNTTANADDVMANFNYLLNNCGSSGGTSQWTTSSSNIYYATGNVGVGTTNPMHTLEVNGSLNVSGTITCGSGCGTGGGSGPWNANGSNIYYSAGSVGIGTTTPSQALAVVGNIYATGNITCGGTCGSGGGGGSWSNSGDNYTTGSVGIGTTSPAAALDIYTTATLPGGWKSNLRLSSTTYPSIRFYASNSNKSSSIGNNNDGSLYFGVNGTGDSWGSYYGLVIAANGYVAVGNTTPSYMLHVNGTAYATGAAGALSDIRDKKDIAPLSITALDAVLKLRPVTFVWKEAKDDGMKGRQTGLIAQEVEKVLPSAILTASDKRKSKAIKYNELTAVLIKAVQEQQKLIAEQNKVVRLQGQELRHQASALRSQSSEILRLQLANQNLEARLARVERNRVARAN